MTIRVRFAPSPTGELHLGGVRTALYCWLYARKHGGRFVLRIEDTDRQRSTAASTQAILDGLAFLGLDYDDGPFYQSAATERHLEVIAQLRATGHAYCCDCSPQRLDELRKEQLKNRQKPRYDGHCRTLEKQDSATMAIRFRQPDEGALLFEDAVYGPLRFEHAELDDLIIRRSDGSPTYNLSVVVDDMDMAISDVIRGDDHINNTPRQLAIWQALGKTPPRYAHLPMIRGSDGSRLSKRHGATGIASYQQMGYLPPALLNYLLRLGWSHGDQEIFSQSEMICHFDLAHVQRSPARFDSEKLRWLNRHYICHSAPEMLAEQLQQRFPWPGIADIPPPMLQQASELLRERSADLVEMAQQAARFLHAPQQYEEQAAEKHLLPADRSAALLALRQQLLATDLQDAEGYKNCLSKVATKSGLSFGQLAQSLRVALTGGTISPPIDATLALLGAKAAAARIDAAQLWRSQHIAQRPSLAQQ